MTRLEQIREWVIELYGCKYQTFDEPVFAGEFKHIALWGVHVSAGDDLSVMTVSGGSPATCSQSWDLVREEDYVIVDALYPILRDRYIRRTKKVA